MNAREGLKFVDQRLSSCDFVDRQAIDWLVVCRLRCNAPVGVCTLKHDVERFTQILSERQVYVCRKPLNRGRSLSNV
jgi:hypothetical protein